MDMLKLCHWTPFYALLPPQLLSNGLLLTSTCTLCYFVLLCSSSSVFTMLPCNSLHILLLWVNFVIACAALIDQVSWQDPFATCWLFCWEFAPAFWDVLLHLLSSPVYYCCESILLLLVLLWLTRFLDKIPSLCVDCSVNSLHLPFEMYSRTSCAVHTIRLVESFTLTVIHLLKSHVQSLEINSSVPSRVACAISWNQFIWVEVHTFHVFLLAPLSGDDSSTCSLSSSFFLHLNLISLHYFCQILHSALDSIAAFFACMPARSFQPLHSSYWRCSFIYPFFCCIWFW